MYDLFIDPPAPLVPRHLRREVRERLLADGSVLRAARRGRRAAGHRRARRRGRRGDRDLPAARLRQPGPRAAAGGAGARDRAAPGRGVRVGGRAGDPRVRAHLDHHGQRVRGAADGALPRGPRAAARGAAASPASSTSCSPRAASRLPPVARRLPIRLVESGPGRRRAGRRPGRARARRVAPALVRHGRHHRQGVRHRRRRAAGRRASSRWRAPTASRRARGCRCACRSSR